MHRVIWKFIRALFHAGVALSLILTVGIYWKQTELILPELQMKSAPRMDIREKHPELVRLPLRTPDGESIELWRFPADRPPSGSMKAAIFFRGNAGSLEEFFPYLEFLQTLGMTSYYYNYRGYGESTGYPTERLILEDARAVVSRVLEDSKVSPAELLLFGLSLGTGPAAFVTREFSPGMLILAAPYSSIDDVVWHTKFWPWIWLLQIHLPTAEYLSNVRKTCVVLMAGKRDEVIPWMNTERLRMRTRARQLSVFLDNDAAHSDIFWRVQSRVREAITACEHPPAARLIP